jgi:hypothetical protein
VKCYSCIRKQAKVSLLFWKIMCNLFDLCSVEVQLLRVTAYTRREARSSTPPSPTRDKRSKSKMVFICLLIPIPSPLRTKRFHRGSLALVLVVRILTNTLSFIENQSMLKEATLMYQLHFRLVGIINNMIVLVGHVILLFSYVIVVLLQVALRRYLWVVAALVSWLSLRGTKLSRSESTSCIGGCTSTLVFSR